MKIAIIGPGLMEIPPRGWGAIESLVWDYFIELEKLRQRPKIFNSSDLHKVIDDVNNFEPDFVHLQYDDYIKILPHIKCEHKAVTSHYAYLTQPSKRGPYSMIFNFYKEVPCLIFALSNEIKDCFMKEHGIPEEKIFVTPNGARDDLFDFREECKYPSRSIYLAKIDPRKRQYLFQEEDLNIDFAGNIADGRFNHQHKNYLGEWTKSHLYEDLTNYANLILLSDGEAHPLSCLEGMMAGLGLVISKYATANLDTSLPFIDVIPENKITDHEYLLDVITSNREKSISMRKEIRKYAEENFSWEVVVKKYYETVKNIIGNE